ncbi:MAG: TraB/GumN family protein [Treponema sp.]|nr:TraB/GumN family protein [Treponema sp.]
MSSKTEKTIELNGRKFTIIGTAHISAESIEEVTSYISEKKPDCVAVELDEKRYESMTNPSEWANLDIVQVLKNNEGFLILANLVLASFQRRMGKKIGVHPGDEMKAAVNRAKMMNIPIAMIDRPISVTLRRAWQKNSLVGKSKLLSTMLANSFTSSDFSSEQIETLKKTSEMDSMLTEFSGFLPSVKEVLIDERDRYIAAKLLQTEGQNILAVIGVGHLAGVLKHMEKIASGQESGDISDISTVEKSGFKTKFLGFLIPAIIIAMLAAGFYFGGIKTGKAMLGSWIIWNGLLAALGTVLAGGHIITILTAFVAAPITSLCPLVGAGMVTGLVQIFVCKPKVSDMENLHDDAANLKSFYKNRILRCLLVFFFSTIGSSLGTFIAGASFLSLSGIFGK